MIEGTTDNSASSSGHSGAGSPSALASLTKVAEAASSAATGTGQGATGDTSTSAGTGTAGSTAGATAQPTGTETGTATAARGEAPEHRIEAAVRNARAEYAWVNELMSVTGLSKDDAKAAFSLLARLRGDSKAFWKQLGEELQVHAGTEDVDEAYPEPDLASQDGRAKAYSSAAMLKALEVQERKLLKKFQSQIQPLVEYQGQQRDSESRAALDARARQIGDTMLTHARTFPGFKENEPAVLEKMKALPAETVEAIGPIAALLLCYNAVYQEKVYPSLESTVEKRVRENYEKKAATAGNVAPSGQVGEGKKPQLRNQSDLAKHMESMFAAASS